MVPLVPESEATDCAVLLRLSAPPLTPSEAALPERLAPEFTVRLPAETVTVPLRVFAPLSTHVPLSDFVSEVVPVPLLPMMAARLPVLVPASVSVGDVSVPLNATLPVAASVS